LSSRTAGSWAGRAESHLLDFMTLERRLQAIRKRSMASRISVARSSALWIASVAALVLIISAGFLDVR